MWGELARLRRDYATGGLAESDLEADPVTMFRSWLRDASAAGLPEPNAMVLYQVRQEVQVVQEGIGDEGEAGGHRGIGVGHDLEAPKGPTNRQRSAPTGSGAPADHSGS